MAEHRGAALAVLGRPGLVHDSIVRAIRSCGHQVVDVADATAHGGLAALLLIEPKLRDWDLAAGYGAPIIVVVDRVLSPNAAVDLLLAGADAVINTSDDPTTVARAIDIVTAGGVLLPRAVAEAALRRMRTGGSETSRIKLTPREREILDRIDAGDAIKQTARHLGISVKTVQNLQSRLFRKLGCRNRAEAITRAHDLGLLRD